MKVEWLNRHLIVGPYLALCFNQNDYASVLKHLKLDSVHDFVNAGANATTHCFTNPEDDLVCVVCLKDDRNRTPIQVASLLVHEAVHVWQNYCAAIGENSPSSEFEAYSIQAISQRLFEEYVRRYEEV